MSSAPPKVVVTHRVHPEVIEFLSEHCRVVANDTADSWPTDEVMERARDAEGLLVFMPDRVDEGFLERCPRLRVIAGALKGYDNFDAGACTRRGIWFTIVGDLLTVPTAELAVGLLLGLARNIVRGDRMVRSGNFGGWRPVLYGTGLAGRTVGIVGMGKIGRTLFRMLSGFGARIVYADPSPCADIPMSFRRELGELLGECHFVILAVSLSDQTRHLIDRDALARMKRGSYLINVGRGSSVEEAAVADALDRGHLSGYAADVFEFEDWALPDRPARIHEGLLAAQDRTVFTPHLGSAVDSVRMEIELAAARSILQVFAGEIPAEAVNSPLAREGPI